MSGRKRTYAEKVGRRTGLNDARARKEKALARLRELDVQEREGKLLPVESAMAVVGALVAELRARIQSFPGKYAPKVVGIKTVGEGQLFLEQLANEMLETLRTAGQDVRDAALKAKR
jgi:hypothetical protein